MSISEDSLAAEIEALRSRVSDIRALYREVAALLFFRHGVTPTVNRLYQLVRKGSMSVPTEALAAFWKELRERSRVRLDQPDLPEPLRELTVQLVGELWQQGLREASATFDHRRAEQAAALAAAESHTREAMEAADRARAATQAAEAERSRLERALAERDAELEARRARIAASEARIEELRRELDAARAATVQARLDFAAELDKTRAALAQSEQRLAEAERRALLRIDEARTQRERLAAALEAQRRESAEQERALREAAEQARLQAVDDATRAASEAARAQGLEQALQAVRQQARQLDARLRIAVGASRRSPGGTSLRRPRRRVAA